MLEVGRKPHTKKKLVLLIHKNVNMTRSLSKYKIVAYLNLEHLLWSVIQSNSTSSTVMNEHLLNRLHQ